MRCLFTVILLACGSKDEPRAPKGEAPPDGVPEQGLRRLTATEYDTAIAQMFGVTTVTGEGVLPEDFLTPFDNDWTAQEPSRVLVEAAENLSSQVADLVIIPGPTRDLLIGPTPLQGEEEQRLRTFCADFGRLTLHRPMADAEVDDLVALAMVFVTSEQDFWQGIEVVVRAVLQDPEFVYRIEEGEEVIGFPEYRQLNDYEIATRASFLVKGMPPDDWLLDQADAGMLVDPTSREGVIREMLLDERARRQVDRFHALWLGYDEVSVGIFLQQPELAADLRDESRQLVGRVVFDDARPWTDLFTLEESWLTPDVARHYGMTEIAAPAWVDVSQVDRAGLLSHGAFLSVAGNVLDTSPTKRGKLVRERLLCYDIPPPPPDANADSPPPVVEGECKVDQYAQHRADPACAGCHDQMDPIGLGLERYDLAGAYREYEYVARTDELVLECPVAGEGEVVGVGTFAGPADLGALLVAQGQLPACMVDHLWQYAYGRPVNTDDNAALDALSLGFVDGGLSFQDLLVALVADERFGWRKLPEVE